MTKHPQMAIASFYDGEDGDDTGPSGGLTQPIEESSPPPAATSKPRDAKAPKPQSRFTRNL